MKSKQVGIRGNNKMSKILNKPIEGKLAETKSIYFTMIVFICLFLVISAYSINELGFETGALFAIGFSVCAVIVSLLSDHQQKRRQKIIKKHPWKAFENHDEH